MSDNSDNRIKRTATPDGGAVYSVTLNGEAEAVIWRAATFHECALESIVATALAVYISAFDEAVRLATEARDTGPRH